MRSRCSARRAIPHSGLIVNHDILAAMAVVRLRIPSRDITVTFEISDARTGPVGTLRIGDEPRLHASPDRATHSEWILEVGHSVHGSLGGQSISSRRKCELPAQGQCRQVVHVALADSRCNGTPPSGTLGACAC